MDNQTKRIIAIIALVFVGIFTVCFPVYLILGQKVEWLLYVVLVSGVIGAVLWFVVFLENRREKNDGREREDMELRTKIAEKELERKIASGETPEEKDVTDDLEEKYEE